MVGRTSRRFVSGGVAGGVPGGAARGVGGPRTVAGAEGGGVACIAAARLGAAPGGGGGFRWPEGPLAWSIAFGIGCRPK